MQNQKNNNQNSNGVWWRQSIMFFVKVSGYIFGPLLIALFLGKYLDGKLQTAPWFFLGLTFLAFVISLAALIRLASNYIKQAQKKDGE